jgi:hypothetical protein
MPPVGFGPTISVLERAKTVLALDRAATAIGRFYTTQVSVIWPPTTGGIGTVTILICIYAQ